MPKFKQTRPVVDQLPASERAAIVGAEIEALVADGTFEFVHGYLKRIRKPGTAQCTYGGCAIAALALVVGTRPAPGHASVFGYVCQDDAVASGLVTQREAADLEDAYEGSPDVRGPFADLGRKLRQQAVARGGRYLVDEHEGGGTAEPALSVYRKGEVVR